MSAKMNRKKGFFSISAVAKMFSVHQQTIRLYEKEGLINPKRSAGNTRLFSEEDVDRLEEIIYLTHKLGINLAGVEMILKLKKQMTTMQKEMNNMFEKTQQQLDLQAEESKMVIKSSMKQLIDIKKETPQQPTPESQPTDRQKQAELFEEDNWEIDYEDE